MEAEDPPKPEELPEYRDLLKEGVVSRIAVSDFIPEAKAVIISEASYLAIRQGFLRGVKAETRSGAAHLAAASSNEATLGLLATQKEDEWESTLLIVSRDLHIEEEGVLGTRDFYFVVGEFSGSGTVGMGAEVALNREELAVTKCGEVARGCRASMTSGSIHLMVTGEDGTAGLGAGIVMNLESDEAGASRNASGRIPELKILYRKQKEELAENVFQCGGLISSLDCADDELPETKIEGVVVQNLPLTSEAGPVIVLREPDFLRLIAEDAVHPEKSPNADAVRIATLGNQQSVLGLATTLVTDRELFEANLTIVARDLGKGENGIGLAREWYVVPGYLKGTAAVYGVAPQVLMDAVFERLFTLNGPCGMVSFPRESTGCDWDGPCIPTGISTYRDPRFGSARWQQGRPRTTIRFPNFSYPTKPSSSYACSEFQPPPPPGPSGTACGQAGELCNGEDDNCNGAVDEGLVCESRCVP